MLVYPVIEKNKTTKRRTILGVYDSEERAREELNKYLDCCKEHNIYIADSEFDIDCYLLNMPI